MNTSSKNRWFLDVALFAVFLVCFFMDVTGVALHQWLGVAIAALALYHLVNHWPWVSAVSRRFFGQTSDQARAYYLIDAVLLGGLLTIAATGLVISTWLDLSLASYNAWFTGHVIASITTLLVLLLKIAQHASWIVSVARKIFAPAAPVPSRAAPVLVTARSSRRDFLKMMGIVGAASLVAMGSSLHSLQEAAGAQETTAESTAATASSITATRSSSSSSSSTSCVVACNRRCSYPGHCRRSTDSNNNGRCDLGECQI